jgi:AcrR family transcriptional regulator
VNASQDQPARQRLTRAEAKARTRELLLEAAATVFASKGFAGASVEEIAQEAGFSIGALYSNFAGKEELFLELMSSRAHERVADTTQVLEDWHASTGQPWQALGQQMADVADKDMEIAALQAEFWLYAVRHPEVMKTFAARIRRRREPLEQLIASELERDGGGYPADVAPRLAVVISALFQGLVRQRRIDPDNVPAELYSDALRWLVTGLRISEGAGTANATTRGNND